ALSLRRFCLWMIGASLALAAILPFVERLDLLLGLRLLQGVTCGTTVPILMAAALKFLPPNIRLHGLALYAMTATFAPNLSVWLPGYWIDGRVDGRGLYGQIIPPGVLGGLRVGGGLPREPVHADHFRSANWTGFVCGLPALALIVVALDQGVRLDWFHSPV